jgi:hypothetical protein
MAFWYTQERMEEGPVFGNRDRWNGLAITFDTFDNDGKVNDSCSQSFRCIIVKILQH